MNQVIKALTAEEDAGTLSLAAPINAPASAGTATASAGTELGVGAYVYAMTYVTGHKRDDGTIVASGETPASPTWTVTTTATNQRVTHASLPTSADVTVVAKRLYRTTVGGAQRKLVATLSASMTAYVDSTPDANLGANEPTTNTTGTKLSGYVSEGRTMQDVSLVKSLIQRVDTRSVTYVYTSGNPTSAIFKDGATVVKTENYNYNANGSVNYVEEIVVKDGVTTTVRTTYSYNTDGTVSGETRTVT